MDDSQIVALYWERNEKALQATADKYGRYCYTIAHNILLNQEERLAYWFDSNTVVICSEVYASSLSTDYYFYRLTDNPQ